MESKGKEIQRNYMQVVEQSEMLTYFLRWNYVAKSD